MGEKKKNTKNSKRKKQKNKKGGQSKILREKEREMTDRNKLNILRMESHQGKLKSRLTHKIKVICCCRVKQGGVFGSEHKVIGDYCSRRRSLSLHPKHNALSGGMAHCIPSTLPLFKKQSQQNARQRAIGVASPLLIRKLPLFTIKQVNLCGCREASERKNGRALGSGCVFLRL